jgi:TldD protein
MLNKNLAFDILTAAMSTTGDFAELYVENCVSSNLLMLNGVVEKSDWGIDIGCGIRIFSGLGAVYAYTNDLSPESLLKLAKEAAQAVTKGGGGTVAALVERKLTNIHIIKQLPDKSQKKQVVELLRRGSASAFAYDKLITQTSCSFADTIKDVLVANTEGVWAEDRRVRSRVSVSAVASSENEKQTGGHSPGGHVGFELFDRLDMEQLGRDSAEIAVKMLKADLCPGGKMPGVIDNGFGGVIFHEACGHSLEATSVAKGASVFAGKLGQQIANEKVTAIDDGTMAGEWGSQLFDDEGTPTQRNVLIENGILKSYLVDKLNGKKMGTPSTGSSRRQNYRFAPTSRMTNTFIAPGKDSAEDIIGTTKYGLYAKKMGGGSVQPATGEFNFSVTEGYMIRDGKIAEPVRGATLIGKGSEILLNIDMVSDNFSMEQGVCGSLSGMVPTNIGQPMIRVKEIIVGGRK